MKTKKVLSLFVSLMIVMSVFSGLTIGYADDYGTGETVIYENTFDDGINDIDYSNEVVTTAYAGHWCVATKTYNSNTGIGSDRGAYGTAQSNYTLSVDSPVANSVYKVSFDFVPGATGTGGTDNYNVINGSHSNGAAVWIQGYSGTVKPATWAGASDITMIQNEINKFEIVYNLVNKKIYYYFNGKLIRTTNGSDSAVNFNITLGGNIAYFDNVKVAKYTDDAFGITESKLNANGTVDLTFSKDVEQAGTFTIGSVATTAEWLSLKKVRLTPETELAAGTHTITATGVKDLLGAACTGATSSVKINDYYEDKPGETVIYANDFDGENPLTYNGDNGTLSSGSVVGLTNHDGGKAIYQGNSGAWATAACLFKYTLTNPINTGIVKVGFDFALRGSTTADDSYCGINMSSTWEGGMLMAFTNGQQMKTSAGYGAWPANPISVGTANHRVEYLLDFTGESFKYNIYLDGTMVREGSSNGAVSLSNVTFPINGVFAYIDNLSISTLKADEFGLNSTKYKAYQDLNGVEVGFSKAVKPEGTFTIDGNAANVKWLSLNKALVYTDKMLSLGNHTVAASGVKDFLGSDITRNSATFEVLDNNTKSSIVYYNDFDGTEIGNNNGTASTNGNITVSNGVLYNTNTGAGEGQMYKFTLNDNLNTGYVKISYNFATRSDTTAGQGYGGISMPDHYQGGRMYTLSNKGSMKFSPGYGSWPTDTETSITTDVDHKFEILLNYNTNVYSIFLDGVAIKSNLSGLAAMSNFTLNITGNYKYFDNFKIEKIDASSYGAYVLDNDEDAEYIDVNFTKDVVPGGTFTLDGAAATPTWISRTTARIPVSNLSVGTHEVAFTGVVDIYGIVPAYNSIKFNTATWTDKYKTYYFDDFENGTVNNPISAKASDYLTATTPNWDFWYGEIGTNKVAKCVAPNADNGTNSRFVFKFKDTVKTGKIAFSYDYKLSGRESSVGNNDYLSINGNGGLCPDGGRILTMHHNGYQLLNLNGWSNATTTSTVVPTDKVNNLTVVFDLDNNKIQYYNNGVKETNETGFTGNLDYISFALNGNYEYIDNLKIYDFGGFGVVSKDSVYVGDTKVNINMFEAVDASTVEGNVSITKDGNEITPKSVSASGKVITVEFPEAIGNGEYEITLNSNVKSIAGNVVNSMRNKVSFKLSNETKMVLYENNYDDGNATKSSDYATISKGWGINAATVGTVKGIASNTGAWPAEGATTYYVNFAKPLTDGIVTIDYDFMINGAVSNIGDTTWTSVNMSNGYGGDRLFCIPANTQNIKLNNTIGAWGDVLLDPALTVDENHHIKIVFDYYERNVKEYVDDTLVKTIDGIVNISNFGTELTGVIKYFDNLKITKEYNQAVDLKVTTEKAGNIFFGDEPIELDLNVNNRTLGPVKNTVSLVVTNYKGETVWSNNDVETFENYEERITTFTPELPYGTYTLNVSDVFGNTYLMNFSRVVENTELNDKVDVAVHFDGRYSADNTVLIDLIEKAGIGGFRTDFTKGNASNEAAANYAVTKGLSQIGLVSLTVDVEPDADGGFNTSEEALTAMKNKCKAIAEQYIGIVETFEIGNETNYVKKANGDKDSGADYYKVLKAAYEGIKEGNPNAIVVSSGNAVVYEDETRNQRPFVTDLLAEMQKEGNYPFDAFGVHPYHVAKAPEVEDYWIESTTWVEQAQIVKDLFTTYGVTGKKIYATETGYSVSKDEDKYAAWIVRTLALNEAHDLNDRMYLYEFMNGNVEGNVSESSFGLIRNNIENANENTAYTAKETYVAVAAFNSFVSGLKALGVPTVSNNVYSVEFTNNMKNVRMLWRVDGTSEATVNEGETAYDINGNEIENEGTVTVGTSPIYIVSKADLTATINDVEVFNLSSAKADDVVKFAVSNTSYANKVMILAEYNGTTLTNYKQAAIDANGAGEISTTFVSGRSYKLMVWDSVATDGTFKPYLRALEF